MGEASVTGPLASVFVHLLVLLTRIKRVLYRHNSILLKIILLLFIYLK